jgi:hypothetical protein
MPRKSKPLGGLCVLGDVHCSDPQSFDNVGGLKRRVAPEEQVKIAQRFSAGYKRKFKQVPEGRMIYPNYQPSLRDSRFLQELTQR